MKDLIIIGARGFGREIYNLSFDCKGCGEEFEVKGFLDDKSDALDGLDGYPPIIDSVENYEPKDNDVFICALGNVIYKKKYAEIILNKGGQFINLIHKSAIIWSNTKIGIGCIISHHVSISCDIAIGDFVTFQAFSTIGHDAKIGSYSHLNAFAFMGGYSEIEENVTLHTGAIIHPHNKVKNNAIVGAGAVVIRNVKENTTVYGNPAKLLKY